MSNTGLKPLLYICPSLVNIGGSEYVSGIDVSHKQAFLLPLEPHVYPFSIQQSLFISISCPSLVLKHHWPSVIQAYGLMSSQSSFSRFIYINIFSCSSSSSSFGKFHYHNHQIHRLSCNSCLLML